MVNDSSGQHIVSEMSIISGIMMCARNTFDEMSTNSEEERLQATQARWKDLDLQAQEALFKIGIDSVDLQPKEDGVCHQ